MLPDQKQTALNYTKHNADQSWPLLILDVQVLVQKQLELGCLPLYHHLLQKQREPKQLLILVFFSVDRHQCE